MNTIEDYVQEMESKISLCNKCNIAPNRGYGWGNIRSKIMFIAQNPDWMPGVLSEDINPFGLLRGGINSGTFFMEFLHMMDLYSFQYYITNAIKCPKENNVVPSNKEVNNCLNFMKFELILQRPRHVVLMGDVAQNAYDDHLAEFLYERKLIPKVFRIWHPDYIEKFPKKFEEWTQQGKGINSWP
jgi:uracil-DNA glycosylase